MNNIDFYELRTVFCGLNTEQAAEIVDASIQTIRRWDRKGAPKAITLLFRLLAGDLSLSGGSQWAGWRVRNGLLYSPEDIGATPGEIRSIPYLHAQISALRLELEKRPHEATPSNVVAFPRGRIVRDR